MAAPAEAPGTQENQLSKSIQHLKVLLRERWHGRADKQLSVQTLSITTHTHTHIHTPQHSCWGNTTATRAICSTRGNNRQFVEGYRVINECAAWCWLTYHVCVSLRASATETLSCKDELQVEVKTALMAVRRNAQTLTLPPLFFILSGWIWETNTKTPCLLHHLRLLMS